MTSNQAGEHSIVGFLFYGVCMLWALGLYIGFIRGWADSDPRYEHDVVMFDRPINYICWTFVVSYYIGLWLFTKRSKR